MKIYLTESKGYAQGDIYAKSWEEAEEVLKYCKMIFDFPPDTEIVGELTSRRHCWLSLTSPGDCEAGIPSINPP